MPSSRLSISLLSVAICSSASAIALLTSEISHSRPFFLSSDLSSSAKQYSFLSVSTLCSFLRSTTSSSIILIILSKPILPPRMASSIKSRRGSFFWLAAWIDFKAESARCRITPAVTFICNRLLAAADDGRVFLKSSSASSSLSTFIVSAKATNSIASVFLYSAHSAFFAAQFASKSARNFLSSASASFVSSKSFSSSASFTPSSPIRIVLDSIALMSALISFFFAAMRESKSAIALSSTEVASAKSFSISSFNCFNIPNMSPLLGA
mmetsp:Transcript_76648/g.121029  ORF Transcript_76648/g.121029 Transcript_76648/m.121029 type:complete len:267 (-) Transcript_76648:652-1452(-)